MNDDTYVIKIALNNKNRIDDKKEITQKFTMYFTSANSTIDPNQFYTREEIEKARKKAYKTQSGAEKGIKYIRRYCSSSAYDDYASNIKKYGRKKANEIVLKKAEKDTNLRYTISIITFSDMLSEIKTKYRDEF